MRRLSFFRANHKARPRPAAKRVCAQPKSVPVPCRKACPRPAAKRACALPQSAPVPCRKTCPFPVAKRARSLSQSASAAAPVAKPPSFRRTLPPPRRPAPRPCTERSPPLPRQKIFPPPKHGGARIPFAPLTHPLSHSRPRNASIPAKKQTYVRIFLSV